MGNYIELKNNLIQTANIDFKSREDQFKEQSCRTINEVN